jgi:hypothetical protein
VDLVIPMRRRIGEGFKGFGWLAGHGSRLGMSLGMKSGCDYNRSTRCAWTGD